MGRAIARFNERLTIQKNEVTVDRYGNHKNIWTDYFTCFTYASTYRYDRESESPDPPFICFLYPGSDNFGADGKVWYKISQVNAELYTDVKDPETEARSPSGRRLPCPARYPCRLTRTASRAIFMRTATPITPSATTWDMRATWSLR